MVPSKDLINELKKSYSDFEKNYLDINNYSSPIYDVIFDLITTESAVMGIANTLIEGDTPSIAHIAILQQPIPIVGNNWTTNDGKLINLTEYPEVVVYAHGLDLVRNIALKVTNSAA